MERMSTLDAGFFFVEHQNVPMHLGSLAVFDGPAPGYQELTELLAAKLPAVPRYRQVVRTTPFQVLWPCWVDDEHFEIGHHVRQVAVPAPGGKRQLRELAATIFAEPLDRGRPLWEAWLLDGLKGGRWAILSKVHHCVVDGIGGNDLMTAIFDLEPDAERPVPAEWEPVPEPSVLDLMARGTAGRPARPAAPAGRAAGPAGPVAAASRRDPQLRPRAVLERAAARRALGGLAERPDRPEPPVGLGRGQPGGHEGDPERPGRHGQRRGARGDHPGLP